MIYVFSKFIALRTLNINSTMINEKLYIPKLILLNLLKIKQKYLNIQIKNQKILLWSKMIREIILFDSNIK